MDNTDYFLAPKIIEFSSVGSSSLGFITVGEGGGNVPFVIKRVYWTYFTPQNVIRGFHSHRKLHQLIFAVAGSLKFKVEYDNDQKKEFILSHPNEGLYLPPGTWRDIQFSHNAVLLCLASELFEESDYIRDYEIFKNETRNQNL